MSGLELHGLKFGWSAVRGEHKWNYEENHVKKSCVFHSFSVTRILNCTLQP